MKQVRVPAIAMSASIRIQHAPTDDATSPLLRLCASFGEITDVQTRPPSGEAEGARSTVDVTYAEAADAHDAAGNLDGMAWAGDFLRAFVRRL